MKKSIKFIILLLILGCIGGGGYLWLQSRQQDADTAGKQQAPDKLYTVKRGNLTIGVLLSGNINT